jgi:heme o synthase
LWNMSKFKEIRTTLDQTVKIGIVKSNLVPMFAGLTLAMYTYDFGLIDKIPEMIFATIGTALIIAAAGAFNNLYDRDIDMIMERTKVRPTVTGDVSFRMTLWLAIIMAVLGVGSLALTTSLAALLGFLGLFLYVVPYTMWTKRRTIWNTEIGSLSGAVPPLIGWAAVYPDISHPALLGLFVIAILWQMPHFYAIAIRRHDDYKAANVPMLPVVKGIKRTYHQTNIYLIIMILASFLLGSLSIGLMLVGLLLGGLWLIISIVAFRQEDSKKWAKTLFIYSLLYMTVMFSTIIIYSLMGIIFNL